MKHLFLTLIAASLVFGAMADDQIVNPDSTGFKFTDVKVIKSTPVKDQNKSGTCWCYSSNTFFENEILRKTGKEIHLSEGFVVYHCYLDKAIKFIRMDGTVNFAEGGSGLDVAYVWENYGAVPNEVYTGMTNGDTKFNTAELTSTLRGLVDVVNQRKLKKLTPSWIEAFKGVLDAYMGKLPETFTWEGKTYTPQSFAASLPLDMNDYISVTSFTHHPFYTQFVLEVADNWIWEKSWNVPLDDLWEIANNAIEKGYTIAWGADVSEHGFKWRNGYAVLVKAKDENDLSGTDRERWDLMSDKDREAQRWEIKGPGNEEVVTQESRQIMFDNKETTDDHGMVIVGTAVDQDGNKYFKVQNSWDTNQLYHGFFYVSEAFFKAKTMNIVINKECIPTNIAKKMGLR